MRCHHVVTSARGGLVTTTAVALLLAGPSMAQQPSIGPRIVRVSSSAIGTSPEIAQFVEHVRAGADAFVFLSGGASKMPDETRRQLLGLFDALGALAARGARIAVGTGGTQAGIMEAAGLARRASKVGFPLVGVAPAPAVLPAGAEGTTPVDPNHSVVVAVDNPGWAEAKARTGWTPDQGYWGSETEAMYALFARLAAGRPAVTVVANGGGITLDEVARNVDAARPMVVIAGSGRAADAIVSLLQGREPGDAEQQDLRRRAQAMGLARRPDLFEVFPLGAGPAELARVLERRLAPGVRR